MNTRAIHISHMMLRLMLGITFILHGKFKVEWGYGNLADWLTTEGIPLAVFFSYALPWIEIIGGLLIVIGLWSRYISILFILILAVALFQVKLSAGFLSNTATGYEFDILMLLVSIHVALTAPSSVRSSWNVFNKGGANSHVEGKNHEV